MSHTTVDDYALTPASGISELAFSPWLVEPSPAASTMSRSSSLSGSDYMSTTPELMQTTSAHLGHTVMYQSVSQPEYMARDPNYVSNPEQAWHRQYNEGYVQPGPYMWNGSMYECAPLPPVEYYAPPYMTGGSSSSAPTAETQRATRPPPNSAPARSDAAESCSGSESDSDDSDYDDDDSSYSQSRAKSASKTKDPLFASMLKLGRWSVGDPFAQALEERRYHCHLIDEKHPERRPCNKRFQRPEHLRRHLKTVHGHQQPYQCKVPLCNRPFSRGDNLRDHYWTHLARGGRAGKNEKMTFLELKAILGPKERKLAKKLKQKLIKVERSKQIKSKL
mgnify:CR=1 FL=1